MPRSHRPLAALAALAAALAPAATAVTAGASDHLDAHGSARMLEDTGSTDLRQVGSFRSALLGVGRLDGRATLTGARSARMVIALRGSKGFLRASGTVKVTIAGSALRYSGTARVTSTDGGGDGLKGRRLRLRGTGDLVENRIAVSLTG